jgi:hypothetical protein
VLEHIGDGHRVAIGAAPRGQVIRDTRLQRQRAGFDRLHRARRRRDHFG